MIEAGHILYGRYEITRMIARGGMGAVYEARDQRLRNSAVAVKHALIPSERMRKAFEREAMLLAGLSHPRVPKVTDYFAEQNEHYLVMNYIPGADLEETLLRQERGYSVDEVLKWADQIFDVLEYLHAQQPPVVHRDIKPSNLKLTPEGHIILLDFGLAKGAGGASSMAGYTAFYAPIEQLTNAGTDARSDIYSLGATIYRLLTGEHPVNSLMRADARLKGSPDPQRRVDDADSGISVHIGEIIQKAMSLDADDRFATAHEMRQALKEAASALSSSARPVPERGNHPGYAPTFADGQAGYARTTPCAKTEAVRDDPARTGPNDDPPGRQPLNEKEGDAGDKNNSPAVTKADDRKLLKRMAARLSENRSWQVTAAGAMILLASLLVWAVILLLKPVPSPEKILSYELIAQRNSEGQAPWAEQITPSTPGFSKGDRLVLKASAPEAGYFYIFNEGTGESGGREINILFPTPLRNNGMAQVAAGQQIEAEGKKSEEQAGTEAFWFIWSKDRVHELERAREAAFQTEGTINNEAAARELRDFVRQHGKSAPAAAGDRRYVVNFAGDRAVSILALKPR